MHDRNTTDAFRRAASELIVAGCVTAAAFTTLCPIGLLAESLQVAQGAVAGQGGQGLPGGASSLQETHGDWRVACAQQNGKKVCAFSQQQTDKDTRQLVLAVELNAPAADRAEGTLILLTLVYMVFVILASLTILFMWLGRVSLDGGR